MRKLILVLIFLFVLVSSCTKYYSIISKEEVQNLAKEYVNQFLEIESRSCGGSRIEGGYCPDFKTTANRVVDIQEADTYWLVNIYFAYTYRLGDTNEMSSFDDNILLKVDKVTGETKVANPEPRGLTYALAKYKKEGKISVRKI